MGPWSGGKSSIINYLLDNEFKQTSLRTGKYLYLYNIFYAINITKNEMNRIAYASTSK